MPCRALPPRLVPEVCAFLFPENCAVWPELFPSPKIMVCASTLTSSRQKRNLQECIGWSATLFGMACWPLTSKFALLCSGRTSDQYFGGKILVLWEFVSQSDCLYLILECCCQLRAIFNRGGVNIIAIITFIWTFIFQCISVRWNIVHHRVSSPATLHSHYVNYYYFSVNNFNQNLPAPPAPLTIFPLTIFPRV